MVKMKYDWLHKPNNVSENYAIIFAAGTLSVSRGSINIIQDKHAEKQTNAKV